jgi:hypothetical protein
MSGSMLTSAIALNDAAAHKMVFFIASPPGIHLPLFTMPIFLGWLSIAFLRKRLARLRRMVIT